MSLRLKLVLALVLLLTAVVLGNYLSGYLLLLWLGVKSPLTWDTCLSYWRAQSLPSFAPYVFKIKTSAIAGFGLPLLSWLGALYLLLKAPGQTRSLHGDARFAGAGDLARKRLFTPDPYGIIVGRWGKRLLRLPGQLFVILAAPTRSGKGVGIVIPNLLEYQGSAVVLDIKQENFALTSGWRASQQQTIYLFNPFAENQRSHRWNPLGYVSPDPNFRITDLQAIAAMLYPHSDQDRFWVGQARNTFLALALYLFEKRDANDEQEEIPLHERKPPTLGQIYRTASAGKDNLKKHLQNLSQKPFLSEAAKLTFANLLSQSEKTFSSIMGFFQAPLHAWLNPILDAATSANDFDLRDVRKKKMTIYIGIQPNKLAESALIVNLFFSQLINVNTNELPEHNPALKYPCLLLMDEFTAIGKVEIIAHAVSYMAGYNLRLLPIIQSRSQLDTVYGPDMARAIFTNHALQILFTPREQQDANEYSEMIGYITVKKDRLTRGRETSRSETEERRALMLPQELKSMDQNTEIFLCEGLLHPVKCGKIRYYEDKRFTSRIMEKIDIPLLKIKSPKGDR
jgi:type IV secretion system protein VirD4